MSIAMMLQISSISTEETVKLGRLLGKQLEGGEIIELSADLGGGKTTFVKGLAAGIGSADRVASPTFTINKIYHSKDLVINHFDFYRLTDSGVLTEQLKESLDNPKAITVVEWSDIVNEVLPHERIRIKLVPLPKNQDSREITITYPSSMTNKIKALENSWSQLKP